MSLAGLLAGAASSAGGDLYFTGFEVSEGYHTNLDLVGTNGVGQNGWESFGSGGNGLVTGFFPGLGYHAYIGFTPPAAGDDTLYLWQPINLDPVPGTNPIVTFSVEMAVYDSTTSNRDDFAWDIYNTDADRLFTVDFYNKDQRIYYWLDGTNDLVFTGWSFLTNTQYTLTVSMDFGKNRWSAWLDTTPLVTNQPITTTNAPLNLGDVDAVWWVFDPAAPGDDFMVFDNYRISADPVPSPRLEWMGRATNGAPRLRLHGQADYRFALEASTNLFSWTALQTNVAVEGACDFTDPTAAGRPQRFYRGRWVP